uniref:DUF4746 domain-containing protein n=1 Tax=Dendroctonus ponderosae TaxID=77166 RepID=A0AAR5PRI3_DENPD
MIYGAIRKPPGTKDSIAQKLITEEEQEQETQTEEKDKVKKETGNVGIWVPPDASVRATVLRMFFPKVSGDFAIPEPAPEPEHLTIIFPLNKKDEALQVMHQYPDEIMKHGLFTSENYEDTTLVARNFKQLDKLVPSERTYSEKLVLQVSKKKSECIFAFAQLEPLYMSPNSNEGKIECEKFFPEDYNAGETEEEEEEEEKQTEDSADKPEVQGILYQLLISVTFYTFGTTTGWFVTIYLLLILMNFSSIVCQFRHLMLLMLYAFFNYSQNIFQAIKFAFLHEALFNVLMSVA